jgi:hypothetical protein
MGRKRPNHPSSQKRRRGVLARRLLYERTRIDARLDACSESVRHEPPLPETLHLHRVQPLCRQPHRLHKADCPEGLCPANSPAVPAVSARGGVWDPQWRLPRSANRPLLREQARPVSHPRCTVGNRLSFLSLRSALDVEQLARKRAVLPCTNQSRFVIAASSPTSHFGAIP